MLINYKNAVATVMDGVVVDLEKLATTTLYGKLMLKSGMKVEAVLANPTLDSFLLSESAEYIRAEPFVIGKDGRVVPTGKLWLNVSKSSVIRYNKEYRMFYVECIPLSIDISQDEVVEFK